MVSKTKWLGPSSQSQHFRSIAKWTPFPFHTPPFLISEIIISKTVSYWASKFGHQFPVCICLLSRWRICPFPALLRALFHLQMQYRLNMKFVTWGLYYVTPYYRKWREELFDTKDLLNAICLWPSEYINKLVRQYSKGRWRYKRRHQQWYLSYALSIHNGCFLYRSANGSPIKLSQE